MLNVNMVFAERWVQLHNVYGSFDAKFMVFNE